jgi:hypothetical protein
VHQCKAGRLTTVLDTANVITTNVVPGAPVYTTPTLVHVVHQVLAMRQAAELAGLASATTGEVQRAVFCWKRSWMAAQQNAQVQG